MRDGAEKSEEIRQWSAIGERLTVEWIISEGACVLRPRNE